MDRMERREQTFLSALAAWETAEESRIVLAEQYREAHAREVSSSAAKTDAARKAEADANTSQLRLDRDFAQMRATALRDKVLFYRGVSDGVERQ